MNGKAARAFIRCRRSQANAARLGAAAAVPLAPDGRVRRRSQDRLRRLLGNGVPATRRAPGGLPCHLVHFGLSCRSFIDMGIASPDRYFTPTIASLCSSMAPTCIRPPSALGFDIDYKRLLQTFCDSTAASSGPTTIRHCWMSRNTRRSGRWSTGSTTTATPW